MTEVQTMNPMYDLALDGYGLPLEPLWQDQRNHARNAEYPQD